MTEKHVRIYYSVIDDAKFANIFHDARAFGTWTQLLLVADAMWPATSPLPAYAHRASIKLLADAGIVDLLPHGYFRMHGLDAERTRRSDQGKAGGLASVRSRVVERPPERTFNERSTNVQGHVELAKQSKAEQSRAEQDDTRGAPSNDPWADPEHEVIAWLSRHGCDVRPGNGYHRKLVTAVEAHGANALIGMMDRLAEAGTKQGDIKGFLFGAIDALDKRSRPSLAAIEKDDRADDEQRSFQARLERTRAAAASMREAASPLSASLVDAMRVEGGFAARLAKEEAT